MDSSSCPSASDKYTSDDENHFNLPDIIRHCRSLLTMKRRQVKALRTELHRCKPEVFALLDDKNVALLPRLRNLHPRQAVNVLCWALNDVETEAQCLQRIAWVRCWLTTIDEGTNWSFYRLLETPTLSKCMWVLAEMASSLRPRDWDASEVPYAWIVHDGAVYACLFTEVRKGESVERHAVCVGIWITYPLLTIRCTSLDLRRAIEAVPLHIRGDLNLFDRISRGSLQAAFQRAVAVCRRDSAHIELHPCATAHQQPQRHLAHVSSGEQRSSVSSAAAKSEPNINHQRRQFSTIEDNQELQSEEAVNQRWQMERPAPSECRRDDESSSSKTPLIHPAQERASIDESVSTPLYTCSACGEDFHDAPPYRLHLSKCPELNKPICYHCGLRFDNNDSLAKHLMEDTTT